MNTRRAFLEAVAATLGAWTVGCHRAEATGRSVAYLWFTYGGRNRQVLEKLLPQGALQPIRGCLHQVLLPEAAYGALST